MDWTDIRILSKLHVGSRVVVNEGPVNLKELTPSLCKLCPVQPVVPTLGDSSSELQLAGSPPMPSLPSQPAFHLQWPLHHVLTKKRERRAEINPFYELIL